MGFIKQLFKLGSHLTGVEDLVDLSLGGLRCYPGVGHLTCPNKTSSCWMLLNYTELTYTIRMNYQVGDSIKENGLAFPETLGRS